MARTKSNGSAQSSTAIGFEATVDLFALVKPDAEHGHVMRMLQVPELQAAMGMPPKMKFATDTRRERIKIIGNAVCPPVMRQVVKQPISGNA